jgi:ATP-dependent Clp protease ATP-binding subunit ClpA
MARRFAADARTTVRRAEAEARSEGGRSIGAEHLLLALSAQQETRAANMLAAANLDHEAITNALEHEFRRSLQAAGVAIEISDRLPVLADPARRLRMSQSAKLALQRALQLTIRRADKRLETTHLLLGILSAERGTVPRALEAAGVDRLHLIESAERALSA